MYKNINFQGKDNFFCFLNFLIRHLKQHSYYRISAIYFSKDKHQFFALISFMIGMDGRYQIIKNAESDKTLGVYIRFL